MFQDNVFFTKGAESNKKMHANWLCYAVHTKIGDTVGCEINGKNSPLQSSLKNGDMISIITSKKFHVFLLSSSKLEKLVHQ